MPESLKRISAPFSQTGEVEFNPHHPPREPSNCSKPLGKNVTKPSHPDSLKIDEYRAKAMEAMEQAALCKESLIRESWESIAQSYHDMAERLERKALGN